MTDLKLFLEQKFNKKFDEKINANEYFFGHVINNITTLDSLDSGPAEHNFSGQHSVSNSDNANYVVDFIQNKLNIVGRHCDIGASIAMLSSKLISLDYESYAIEGHDLGIRANAVLIPKEKYAVFDMGSMSLDCLDLYKYFDITTAFEVTEHVPEDKIKMFYDNCAYISKTHLCSVHWGGEDNSMNPNCNHYNVKPIEWWVEFLGNYGEVTVTDLSIPTFGESTQLFVKFDD